MFAGKPSSPQLALPTVKEWEEEKPSEARAAPCLLSMSRLSSFIWGSMSNAKTVPVSEAKGFGFGCVCALVSFPLGFCIC